MQLKDFLPLRSQPLARGSTYHQPTQNLPDRVTFDSPATDVMTDLRQVTAITIPEMATLEIAQRKMKRRGVRSLFVVGEDNSILGILTLTDLQGEKPMQMVQKSGLKREEILVRDIMTPQDRIEVLAMADVASAKVGHIVATLIKTGRQHALVADALDAARIHMVHGIFAVSQISRQLGVSLDTIEVASTFAEVGERLSR